VPARLQLREVRSEDLVAGQVEEVAAVVAPGALQEFHLAEVVGDDEPLERRVCAVELVTGRDLGAGQVLLLVGQDAELVVPAHDSSPSMASPLAAGLGISAGAGRPGWSYGLTIAYRAAA
jgi:hypothetical protein